MKLPPIPNDDLRNLVRYGIGSSHLNQLWRLFLEIDVDCKASWTLTEVYKVIGEPRLSMRAPVLDSLYTYADSKNAGSVTFHDFVVAFVAFCSLSAEEILQFMFIIVDIDRNGKVEKEELLQYFSYIPLGCGDKAEPPFPVNNKNALDKFRGGKWEYLDFDGLVQLCEQFPYISYPVFHVQELFRAKLLGRKFWDKLHLDRTRLRTRREHARKVHLPGTYEMVDARPPGRVTMRELLEFSRRKTRVHMGKRVLLSEDELHKVSMATHFTRERDNEISVTPVLCMIRNPSCMYHVPFKATETVSKFEDARPELELEPEFEVDPAIQGFVSTTTADPMSDDFDNRIVMDPLDEDLTWQQAIRDDSSIDSSSEEEHQDPLQPLFDAPPRPALPGPPGMVGSP